MSTGGRGRGNTLPMRLRRSVIIKKNVCYVWSFFCHPNLQAGRRISTQCIGWQQLNAVLKTP